MNSLSRLLFSCSFVVLSAVAAVADTGLEGNVKLNVAAYGNDEFFVLKPTEKDGAWTAEIVAKLPNFADTTVKSMTLKDGVLDIVFAMPGGDAEFHGMLAKDGTRAGQFLGTMRLPGTLFPAWIAKTQQDQVAELKPGPIMMGAFQLRRETDAKQRIEKLRELADKSAGDPALHHVYPVLLQSADTETMKPAEVKALVARWLEEAAPFGSEWATEVRLRSLSALYGKKPYAEESLALAEDARKLLPAKASTEQKAALAKATASAAELLGKADLAKESKAQLAEFEAVLDKEYLAKVPPFKPTPFPGRKAPTDNRVVLMELFTGTQCPPCVAADVAFDGLVKTYQPSEVVLLQYHLHIPGPDPLTNPDTLARSQYYVLRGTPSTYFNGMAGAPGGGGMANSKSKYEQFRETIDDRLEGTKRAKIELNVKRDGQKLAITASAQAEAAKPAKAEDKKADEVNEKPALRLVLTEETVRYVGSNGVRFHHHVVRSFPGGVEGKPLADGKGEIAVTVDLTEVKASLDKYVADYAKTRPFANDPPPVELKHLSVVAFVQDDVDKSVWHAHQVEVPE